MKINNVTKALFVNIVENEFQDVNSMPVKWYYLSLLIDDELIRMKLNSKKLVDFDNVAKYSEIDIEYDTTYKLVSEDGTKYTAQFEYVGILPFTDINKPKKGDKE